MITTELGQNELKNFPDFDAHEKIVRVEDGETGLKAFIGIHNTALGPALGGCRMMAYASEGDAIKDVLRLSRGMTYKNALAGLPLGGGKSVIMGDSRQIKTPALMRAMGRAVESLQGRYITAEDSGTGEADMEAIARETSYVVGIRGEGDLGGNPSPVTAYGVYCGMKAAAQSRFGSVELAGRRVAVQGLGAVGYELCRLLHTDGVGLVVTDIRPDITVKAQAEFPGLQICSAEEIFSVDVDILACCALGGQLNDDTIPHLKAAVIAGAANNQLATARHADLLAMRNILYAPDYVMNAGGVIAVAYEYFKRSGRSPFGELTRPAMLKHVQGIGAMLTRLFDMARESGITPARAADSLAAEIFRGGAMQAVRAAATN